MCDVSTLTNECSVWSRLERVTILFDVMTMLMIIKQRKKGGKGELKDLIRGLNLRM